MNYCIMVEVDGLAARRQARDDWKGLTTMTKITEFISVMVCASPDPNAASMRSGSGREEHVF